MTTSVVAVLGKGGSGKTTSAAAIADAAARRGKSVLLIDLDVQTSLSDWLAPSRAAEGSGGVEKAVLDNEGLPDLIVPLRGDEDCHLDFLPGTAVGTLRLEHDIERRTRQRELVLSKWLKKAASGYDLVVLDTPRGLVGALSLNALEAADAAVLPLDPTGMGLDALREQVALVEAVGEDRGVRLLAGVLPTRVTRTRLSSVTVASANESGYPVLPAIPSATAVAEAVLMRQLLARYAPNSPATAAYEAATDRLLEGMT